MSGDNMRCSWFGGVFLLQGTFVFLLLTVLPKVVAQDALLSDMDVADVKACYPGEHTFYADAQFAYERLKRRYEGCTHVFGNLVIANVEIPEADLSFLKDIRYVSGFVAIFLNTFPATVSLPSLEVIRGNESFYEGRPVQGLPDISLLVSISEHRQVLMPRLREISAGNVHIDLATCPHLCQLDTVDWHSVLRHGYANVTSNNATCQPCDAACRGGHCWGPEADQCQQLKEDCNAVCEHGLCVTGDPAQCCHPECAIGCHGPSALECTACRDFIMELGLCHSYCPLRPRHRVDAQFCIPVDF